MREYDEERGLYFEVGSDGAFVTDSESRINEVIIPEEYKGKPVLAILKKAFLGRKQLRRVTIPGSVKSIGQWAFSSCDALRSVRLKRTECIFERGVFKGDKRLESIYIEGESKEIARLLAASVVMEADYLLEPMTAGSSEWLDKWDGKLSSILDQADDEGYHLYVLCGEEDLHYDYDQYLEYMRKKKAGLCMLRLLNSKGLSRDLEDRLSDYLREHTKGCESEAAFRYLTENHGDDIKYYELMISLSCINEENLEAVISDLSDRHAEAKSFILNSFGGKKDDFFDDLFI